ncbi:large conductance mechanosensitive channel protein MscL [Olsenella urininfantis]|uniref:large conductance mechanosensitive channel protein MscL n=1 Tax=Olsenella urininfantis TaxID=1871033 RepID=UPI000987834C|nr:large conductance mechanosensitive channel protein MscL [Olsenella urininfantis]
MKKFMSEFKEFIARGNVMDMAVGIIIGGAFTAIVTSLVTNIINPLITLITGGASGVSGLQIPVNADTVIDFGAFISAIINFLIIALVVFSMVKALNKLQEQASRFGRGKQEKAAPAVPVCPHCLEEVKEGATRCPHCAGEIPGGAKA